MSILLSWLSWHAASLVPVVHDEVDEIVSALGLSVVPAIDILAVVLKVFSALFAITALGIVAILFIPFT